MSKKPSASKAPKTVSKTPPPKAGVRAHKTFKQSYQQSVTKTFCAQRSCKLYGKEAKQGVCYSNEGELADWAKLAAHEKKLLAELEVLKKDAGKDYQRVLEAHYVSAVMNWQLVLDECIRLRRDATLRSGSRKSRASEK